MPSKPAIRSPTPRAPKRTQRKQRPQSHPKTKVAHPPVARSKQAPRYDPGRGVTGATDAYGFMNPAGNKNLRLSFVADSSKTAVFGLHNVVSVPGASGTNPTSVSDLLPFVAGSTSGYGFCALFHSVLRSVVMFTPNSAALTWTYTAQFYIPSGTLAAGTAGPTYALENAGTGSEAITPLCWSSTSNFAPHGPQLFLGFHDRRPDLRFTWLNKFDTVTFTLNQSAPTSDRVHITRFGPSLTENASDLIFTGDAATWAAPSSAYYAFTYEHSTAQAGLVLNSAVLSSSADCLAHLSVPGIWNRTNELSEARVNAASMLLSNDANLLNREGRIYAANLPATYYFGDYLSVQQIESCSEYTSMPLATGAYAWSPPTTGSDHYTNFGTDGTVPTDLYFRLVSDNRMIVFMSVVSCVGNSFPALDLVLTIWQTIEAKTNSQWYETRYAALDKQRTDRALSIISRVPLEQIIMENPLHLSDIAAFLRRGVGHLRANAGKIGGALSLLFPEYAPAIGGLSAVLSK